MFLATQDALVFEKNVYFNLASENIRIAILDHTNGPSNPASYSQK